MSNRTARRERPQNFPEYGIALAILALTLTVAATLASQTIASYALLIPLTALITHHDLRYRRIPNPYVLATFLSGLLVNIGLHGSNGAWSSAEGCLLAFIPAFILHLTGMLGAGDVKLFAAIGALAGISLFLPLFFFVAMTVISFNLYASLRSHTAGGYFKPIPYGVAITLGSLIALAIFRP